MNLNSQNMVSILEEVKKFLEDKVTSKVWFQTYPEEYIADLFTDIDQNAYGMDWTYDIQIEHPIVKLMTYKSVTNRKDLYAPTTQIVVQMLNSNITRTADGSQFQMETQIRLEIISCCSGVHANEVYYKSEKTETESLPFLVLGEYETTYAAEYLADGNGWMDVLHLADMIKRELISCPGGRISGNLYYRESDGINIAPKGSDEEIFEMHPYYIADMEFTVISYITNRTNEDLYDGL